MKTKLTVAMIRAMKAQLTGAAVLTNKERSYAFPVAYLENGVVYCGNSVMHPSTFIDIYGEEKFRSIRRDVSKSKIEQYIRKYRKAKEAR